MNKCHETSQLHQHVAPLLACLGSLNLLGRSHRLCTISLSFCLMQQDSRWVLKLLQHQCQPLT